MLCKNRRARMSLEGLVGNSSQMQDVFRMIRRVGPSDVPVLITGESGTGKELVARAIHRQSARKSEPFVAINCGAIPETLLESELFGYEKGAFTGATQQRKGRIESAQRGTLFLDEIGDIPLALQVKLLRFLQDHTIQRLGAKETIAIDARILAATNVDLQKAISEGRFREDLYYRLCVVTIAVPALSERGSDITLLARTFLTKFAEEEKKPLKGFTPQAVEALRAHTWPGNVRELENRIKRAVVMAEGKYVTPENLELKDPLHPKRKRPRSELHVTAVKRIWCAWHGKSRRECVSGCCGTWDQPAHALSVACPLWIEEDEIRRPQREGLASQGTGSAVCGGACPAAHPKKRGQAELARV